MELFVLHEFVIQLRIPLRSVSMPYMSTSSDASHTSMVGVAGGGPGDDIFDMNQTDMDMDVESREEEAEPAYSPMVRGTLNVT